MPGLTPKQHETLMRPLNGTRVAKRTQGGKQLSYLEAWDVRAHLIRVFGFTNFDAELEDYHFIDTRRYTSTGDNPRPMVEVIYAARMRLTLRDSEGAPLATYAEAAVGSASGPETMLGEHHDNALKTAASDALKRCAMNLGTQFGLSLYDNGRTTDVVRGTLVPESGEEAAQPPAGGPTEEEATANLQRSLGAKDIGGADAQPDEDWSAPEGHDDSPDQGVHRHDGGLA